MQINLRKTILAAGLLFISLTTFSQGFNTIWRGIDTLYVEDNCKAYFYWTNPTPENSLFVTAQSGTAVTVNIARITPSYMLRDSVPAGISLRLRYEFSDQNGNSGFFNKNIPVIDTIAPKFDTLNSPRDITVNCVYELSDPTVEASDNCDGDIVYDFSEGTAPEPCQGGTFDRIWIATDESGNKASLKQTITVNPDTLAPQFTAMPQDTQVQCGQAHGTAFLNWLNNQIAVVQATDQGCGLAELSWMAPDTTELVNNCGPQEVVFSAVDSCGNETEVSAFFEIVDIFAPTIERLANDTIVNCAAPTASQALQDWISRNGGARATDNCGPISWSTIPENPVIENSCSDTVQIVFRVQDACGNQSSTRANFIFSDNTSPFFTSSPSDLSIRCDTANNIGGLFGEWLTSGAFAEPDDHCNNVDFFAALPGSYELNDEDTWPGTLPEYPGDLTCSTPDDPGSSFIDIDFVYFDACGNAVVQARRFTIIDSLPPLISNCAADTFLSVDGQTCLAEYQLKVPDSEEECLSDFNEESILWTELIQSSIPGDTEAPVDTVVINIPVGNPYNPGSLGNVNLTLDFFNLDANEPEEYFNVFNEDGELLGQTSIQSVECVNFQEVFDQISGSDLEKWIMDGELTITLIPNIPQGMSTRQAINDKCGGSSVNATVRFFAGIAGNVLYDYKIDEGAFSQIDPMSPGKIQLDTGEHVITYRIYDCQGNADSCKVSVSVTDQTPPNITCPDDATISLDEGSCSVSQSVTLPFGLVDNCSGLESLSLLIVGATNSGPEQLQAPFRPTIKTFERGISTIIYTVRDSSGNQSNCNFNWTVIDETAPDAICQSISVTLDPTGINNYVLEAEEIDGGSLDNCGITSLSIPATEFDCSQAGEEIPVVLTVSDESGNQDSCTAIIRVLLPVLNPTYSVDICGDDTLKLFANTATMGNDPFTYEWTGPNGFSSNLKDPKRANASSSFSGTYRVIATGFNGCVSEGTVLVSINDFNTPTLQSEKTRYCSNEDILLEATSYTGTVTYEWYKGVPPNGVKIGETSTPNFLIENPPAGVHRYYVIVKGNNCTTNPSAVYQIEVVEALIAEVDDPFINVCEGDRILLGTPSVGINYSYQWTGPNGFTSDRQYPPAIEPADPGRHNGVYMLIISNGTCTSQPAMVEVNVGQKPPTPRIDINQIACEGDTITLFVPNISQGQRYFWTRPDGSETLRLNDNTLFVRALPSNEGQWTVRVEVDGCSSEQSAPFVLNVEEQLNFIAINDGPVCEGDSVTLSAELIPGATYRWTGPGNFRSNMREVRTPAFNGIYTVELTTPNGCISSADTRVELRLVPRITALSSTGDSTCVTGVECINLTPTVFPADIGQYTYEWTGPNGFTASGSNPCVPNATEDINGVYQLIVSNGECRSNPENTTVRVFNTPAKPVLDGNTLYCVGDTLFLSARVTNPTTNWNYSWITPGQIFETTDPTLIINNVSNNNDGYYSLIIENGPCSSESSDSLFIEIAEQPDRPVILPLPVVCEGDSIRLRASSNPNLNFMWTGPNNFSSSEKEPLIFPADLSDAGDYRLVVEAGSCRSPSSLPSTLFVNARPAEAVVSEFPERICIDAPGSVIEICAEPNSLTDTAFYEAILLNNGNVLGSTSSRCLTISSDLLQGGNNEIIWIGNSNGCLSDTSNIINIRGDEIPDDEALAGMDISTCDSTYLLRAGIPDQAAGSWSSASPFIQFGDINDPGSEVSGLVPGENELIWTLSFESCTDYDSDTITIFRDIEPLANPDAYTIDIGLPADFMVTLNDDLPINYSGSIVQGPFNGTAVWNDPGTISYTPNNSLPGVDSILYRICPDACPDLCSETWVRISIGDDKVCNVPTIITPNGDEYNDILVINCLRPGIYPQNSIRIFNVWGDEVFSASPYENDWNGDYNGNPLPEGSYYFVFDLGDGTSPTVGFIIIKR